MLAFILLQSDAVDFKGANFKFRLLNKNESSNHNNIHGSLLCPEDINFGAW
jgi:hypothetical protein